MDYYKTAYVGMTLPPTSDLLQIVIELCHDYCLIPRPELHLTLGYIGEMDHASANALGTQLSAIDASLASSLECLGVGGAYGSDDGTTRTFNSAPTPTETAISPRVMWLAIKRSDVLISIRNGLIAAAKSLGLDTQYLRPMYSPHVTIGSSGPVNQSESYALWDVHDIEKTASLVTFESPRLLNFHSLHITDVPTQPSSIFVVHSWSKDG